MKKIIVLVFFAFLINKNSKAQEKIDCNNKYYPLPSASSLIARLQNKPINISPRDFANYCNITDSVKDLLLYHLRWQWTKKEKENYLDRIMESYKEGNKMEVDQILSGITRSKDTLLLNHLADSILKSIRQREFNNTTFYSQTDNVMLIIGWLNLKEAIQFLKDSALKDQANYPKWAVELALAKMGNKNLQKKIIAASKFEATKKSQYESTWFEITKKLRYLNTQESLFTLHELIDTTTFIEFTTKEDIKTPIGRKIVEYLPYWIKNEELKNLVKLTGDDYDYNLKAIMAVKQWMIKNKGKYILANSMCPY